MSRVLFLSAGKAHTFVDFFRFSLLRYNLIYAQLAIGFLFHKRHPTKIDFNDSVFMRNRANTLIYPSYTKKANLFRIDFLYAK